MISPKLCASRLALELLRAAVHAAAVTVALATCTVEGPRAGAADAAAARLRAAPPQAPARQGGGAPPFSDVPQRRMSIGVGPMGAFISM